MSFSRHEEIYRPMSSMPGGPGRTALGLIGSMSFRLAIHWRVALPQGPPPLHQPVRILQGKAFTGQCNCSERQRVS